MNQRIDMMSGVMLQALSATEQDVLVDLWELDLRALGGELLRFCNQVNERGQAVVWKGQAYEPYPIEADGFELSGKGASNRPKIKVSNLLGLVTGLTDKHNQLVGAVVVRRQVLARFLDTGNFIAGNATADPTQEVVSKFVIEQLSSMTAETAIFELAVPSEADGAVFPARIMLAGICPWQYRGEECGYTGRPVADRFDMPTDDPNKDACSGLLTGCRARFGITAVLPFGGFPACDKVTS